MPTDYESNRFVESYAQTRGLSAVFVNTWASRLAKHAPAEEVSMVLDIGAGVGRFWPVFQAAWAPRSVIAVDRSWAMLREADANLGVLRVVGDLDAIPVRRDGSFDVAFCSMALHYSRDPRACIHGLASAVRPGGWLVIRTGTDETLASFDFLRFFPTALAAEHRAMPSLSKLLGWLTVEEVEVVTVEDLPAGPPTSRRLALRTVLGRGFPSLQLVPRYEWALGSVRYALHLSFTWLTRSARPRERSVLLVASRP